MRLSEKYLRADSLDEAIEALHSCDGDAVVLAGGTVVASLVNQKLLEPALIVDISRLEELRHIERRAEGGLLIGPLTTHDEVLRSADVARECPLLAEIADEISCSRLRNRGTVGGSLCTVGGQGDTAVGLMAVGAHMRLRGPDGERLVPIEEFYGDAFSTVVQPDELLTDIQIEPLPRGASWAFGKVGPRKAMDFTLISVSVMLTKHASAECIDTIRIGVNGVTDTATRLGMTEDRLVGASPNKIDWQELRSILDEEIHPQADSVFSEQYKRHLCTITLKRTVQRAWSRQGMAGDA